MKYTLMLISLVAILFVGCGDDEFKVVQEDLKQEYFPLEIGKFRSYQLDSIIFDPSLQGTDIDTISHLIREEVVDTTSDAEGEGVYIVHRSFWINGQWVVRDVLQAKKTQRSAELVDNNLRFVKMNFPPKINETWNANQYFDPLTIVVIAGETLEFYKLWESRVLDAGMSQTIAGVEFDQILHIQLAESENLIELRRGFEKYAFGIGLVEREVWVLDTQKINDAVPWTEKAQKGAIIRQVIIDYN